MANERGLSHIRRTGDSGDSKRSKHQVEREGKREWEGM